MSENATLRLRKADFWTSLVLFAVAGFMLVETLGYPLEGSYAGVRNVWYVSPALFPLIVAGMLILLSAILLVHSVRSGGARAALADLSATGLARSVRAAVDVWIVCFVLAGYIYALVPRIDFVPATILMLFTLLAVYNLAAPAAAARALALYAAIVVAVALGALAGFEPVARSAGAFWRDGAILLALTGQMAIVVAAERRGTVARGPAGRCLAVALVTPLLLAVIFKYALLVPLPYEGLTVELMDRARYAIF